MKEYLELRNEIFRNTEVATERLLV